MRGSDNLYCSQYFVFLQYLAHAGSQDFAYGLESHLRVVGGPVLRLGKHAPFAIDQREAGLGSAAIHAKEAIGSRHGVAG